MTNFMDIADCGLSRREQQRTRIFLHFEIAIAVVSQTFKKNEKMY